MCFREEMFALLLYHWKNNEHNDEQSEKTRSLREIEMDNYKLQQLQEHC